MKTQLNITNRAMHRIVAACALCMAVAGPALAGDAGQGQGPGPGQGGEPARGIVDLATNYGASGAIASVVGFTGVNGAADRIEVTFASAMHPGNFGMGVNFAKAWTKSWNADNTKLTIGGDIDFSDAAKPALIVYLMQTEAERRDISEPNIFKFQDIKVTGVEAGNGQINVEFDNPGIKGHNVYLAKSATTRYKEYGEVAWHAKGVHIKGLANGQTYWFYLEYSYYDRKGLVATRTDPIVIALPNPPGNGRK